MTAGENRKFHRNLMEQPSARRIAFAGLSLLRFIAPVALVLMLCGIVQVAQHGFKSHDGVLIAATVPFVLPAANIKMLRQQRADLKAKASTIFTLVEKEKRDFNDDERKQLDELKASLATVDQDIERVEAFLDAERKAPPAAGAGARADISEQGKRGFADLGEQLVAVHALGTKGIRDERLFAAAQGSNEAVDSEGGVLVAPEFTSQILQRTYENGQVASRCFEMPMASNRLVLNAVDEDSRADGSRWGGLLAYWAAEAGKYNGTKPKFRPMQVTANKLIGLVYVTDEQIEDAPALMAYVNKAMPDEFTFKIEDAIFNGAGAGMPLGINNSGALLTVAKAAGDVGKTVSTDDVLAMWSRMWAPSRQNAVWFTNQDVEPKLYPLTLGTGTAVQLLYTPPGQRGNQYGLLLGRPVIPIEQAATLGTPGDIVLADMSQYILGKKGGIRADASMHVAFLTGEQAFRFTLRLDGQPTWKKPLTPKNGANTLSPFVALAARA